MDISLLLFLILSFEVLEITSCQLLSFRDSLKLTKLMKSDVQT